MKLLKTISLIAYILIGLMGLVFAYLYLSRSEFMPYHAVAVGRNWQDVDPGMQVLIIALMRVSGGGWLATSLGIALMIWARNKYKQLFFSAALVLIGLGCVIPTLIATLYVRNNSPANPPWIAATLAILILVIAFIFDWIAGSKSKAA